MGWEPRSLGSRSRADHGALSAQGATAAQREARGARRTPSESGQRPAGRQADLRRFSEIARPATSSEEIAVSRAETNERKTEFLTQKQAAEVIGVHQNTLNKLSKAPGGPPFSRISTRCLRYRRDLLLAWMESKQEAA